MSTRKKPTRSDTLSRRRFVALVAAGSAALLARPAAAAAPAPAAKKPAKSAPAAPVRVAKPAGSEIDRQRAATLETLKTIREHALGAGADLGYVFRPVRRTRGK